MFRSWPLKITAVIITGCLLLSVCGVYPAGAMIFPELLKLVRVDKPESVNPSSDTDGTGEQGEQPVVETYVVKPGDTLWGISRKYNIDCRTIADYNKIEIDQVIRCGQVLQIPTGGAVYHVVRKGESLWEIARKYGLDVETIASANGISDPGQIPVGKTLLISRKEAVPVTAKPRQSLPSRGMGLWEWPVTGPITQTYGQHGGDFHHGLDIAAEVGKKIFPVQSGRVEFSGWLNGIYGRAVIIDHGNGLRTLYAHNSKNLVEKGQYVDISTAIAKIGNTGRTTGPHLHIEVHIGEETADPQLYLTQLQGR